MANVLLVAYLLIVLAMIAVILLQRSEGGGLGMGGGGGGGGLMTARGSANLLTRTTGILAALFFATAIGLTIVNEINRGSDSVLDSASQSVNEDGSPSSVLDALNKLQGDDDGLPVPSTSAPADETPATDASPAEDAPDLAIPEPSAPDEGSTGSGN